MPFDPVVVALQMMVPAEAAATNQVSAVSYFFISPSAEKRNPVKNPVDRRVEPPGGTFADRAAFAADGAYNEIPAGFSKASVTIASPGPSRRKAHVAEAQPIGNGRGLSLRRRQFHFLWLGSSSEHRICLRNLDEERGRRQHTAVFGSVQKSNCLLRETPTDVPERIHESLYRAPLACSRQLHRLTCWSRI